MYDSVNSQAIAVPLPSKKGVNTRFKTIFNNAPTAEIFNIILSYFKLSNPKVPQTELIPIIKGRNEIIRKVSIAGRNLFPNIILIIIGAKKNNNKDVKNVRIVIIAKIFFNLIIPFSLEFLKAFATYGYIVCENGPKNNPIATYINFIAAEKYPTSTLDAKKPRITTLLVVYILMTTLEINMAKLSFNVSIIFLILGI